MQEALFPNNPVLSDPTQVKERWAKPLSRQNSWSLLGLGFLFTADRWLPAYDIPFLWASLAVFTGVLVYNVQILYDFQKEGHDTSLKPYRRLKREMIWNIIISCVATLLPMIDLFF